MGRLSLEHKPKTEQGKHRLKRMREKAKREGALKPTPARCTLDSRYPCNPEACPPAREHLANIRTTGERRPCQRRQ